MGAVDVDCHPEKHLMSNMLGRGGFGVPIGDVDRNDQGVNTHVSITALVYMPCTVQGISIYVVYYEFPSERFLTTRRIILTLWTL